MSKCFPLVLFYGCVAGEVSKNRLLGIHAWKEQLLSKEQWNNNVTNSKPSVVRSSMATFEWTCSEHTLLTVMGRSVPASHYQDKVSRRLLKNSAEMAIGGETRHSASWSSARSRNGPEAARASFV